MFPVWGFSSYQLAKGQWLTGNELQPAVENKLEWDWPSRFLLPIPKRVLWALYKLDIEKINK